MKYHLITHGCQMNEHDSERIAALLEQAGYTATHRLEEADLVLFNTCLVRENAELKVLGQIGALKKWRNEKEDRILAVSGCMMQTGPAKELIERRYPQVDLVFGTKNIEKLPYLLKRVQAKERVFDTEPYEADGGLPLASFERNNHFSAYVNIMTGCNNFCSYCIVPHARGREQSRPPRAVLEEVSELARKGYLEITLLGQNVNSYGQDFDCTFPDLLRQVARIDGIRRVRFMSSHPKDLSSRLIEVMAENPVIERHFHLPLQSGSDRVLKEMNRKYQVDDYRRLVNQLRAAMPEITLTTDLIVGFPGEREEDHQATLALLRELKFDNAFTFLYSVRPGTLAAARSDQVPSEIKSRRYQELCDTLYPIFYQKNQSQINRLQEVLFDTVSKKDESKISGRDSGNRLIHVKGPHSLVGQIKKVKITEANSFALMGTILED